MSGWRYSISDRGEKLVRWIAMKDAQTASGIQVPDGGVLFRNKRGQIQVASSKLWPGRWPLFLSLCFPTALAVMVSQGPSSISHQSDSSVLVRAEGVTQPIQNIQTVSPTSPQVEIPRASQQAQEPKGIESSAPKNVHAQASTSSMKQKKSKNKKRAAVPPEWKKVESKIQKHFMSGELHQASRILASIAEKQDGTLPKELWALEAEIAYAKCRSAFHQKRWRQAVTQCELATSKQPHSRASAILDDLGARAEKSYLEGYVMEGTNRRAAIRRYRDAMDMAPTGHAYREKARKKLKFFDSPSIY